MLAMANDPVSAILPEAFEEPLVLTRRGGGDVAFVCDPDVLEEILVRRADEFPKSHIDMRILQPAVGDGLLTASGEDWRWKRRLTAPYFSPAALKKSYNFV